MFGDLLRTESGVVDLTKGLKAHYLLNNNSDDCHGAYDGFDDTAITYTGEEAKFNGIDGYINIPHVLPDFNILINPICISMWCTIESLTETTWVGIGIASRSTTYKSYATIGLRVVGGVICAGVYLKGYKGSDATPIYIIPLEISIGINELVHLHFEYTRMYCKVYANGVLIGTQNYNYNLVDYGYFDDAIGIVNDNTQYRFSLGTMSNLRFYEEIKNQAFIDELYVEGYYPKPLPLPTTDGLIARYPLTGTAEDSTGNNDGTEVGNSYVDDAQFGSVLDLSGGDYYVSLPLSSELNAYPFTITAWLYIDGVNYQGITISDNTASNKAMFMYYDEGNGRFVLSHYDGTYTQLVTKTETAVGWYYVECVFKNNDFEMLVDNVSAGTNTGTYNIPTNINSVNIGKLDLTSDAFYHGKSRSVSFYNDVLTTQERTDVYNYEKNFRSIDIDDGLVAFYPLKSNSLDNYYNEWDANNINGVTFDGDFGTFNGVNQSLTPPIDTFGGTSGSVSGWFRGSGYAFSATEASTSDHVVYFHLGSTGTLKVFVKTTSIRNTLTIATSIIPSDLNHIAILSTGSSYKIYINSVDTAFSVDEGVDNGKWFGDLINHGINKIGAVFWSIGNAFFTGEIGNFRIFDRALSAEQVEVIYNTEKESFYETL